ncbi:MAG: hypothetical protein V3U75_01395 [Methylococcaceae bacterium]
MNYNRIYNIEEMTASAGPEDFKNVFAERRELETPFIDAAEVCIRGFLFCRIVAGVGGLVFTIALMLERTDIDNGSSILPSPLTFKTMEWRGSLTEPSTPIGIPVRANPVMLQTNCLHVIKISGLKIFHPDSLNRVYEKIEFYLERVKVFSPEMDFFTSSTVMPQRDLTGQDYFLITPPMIFKLFSSLNSITGKKKIIMFKIN